MTAFKSISILQPCRESWQNMTALSGGRHCQSCCKTVTDFTKMSNAEIVAYLSANTNVCGRFNQEQFPAVNNRLQIDDMPVLPGLKGWAFVLSLLSSTVCFTVKAQTKDAVVQAPGKLPVRCSTPVIGKVYVPKIIRGQVLDEHGQPLPQVTISLLQGGTGTITDNAGNFTMEIPQNASQFKVSRPRYLQQIVPVSTNECYTIKLQIAVVTMGEVIIVKRPFLKQMFYQYIWKPYHKLF